MCIKLKALYHVQLEEHHRLTQVNVCSRETDRQTDRDTQTDRQTDRDSDKVSKSNLCNHENSTVDIFKALYKKNKKIVLSN